MRISKTKKRTIFHTFLLYNLSCIHFSTGPRPDGSPIPYAPQQQLFVSASKHGVVQSSNILNYNSSYTHHRGCFMAILNIYNLDALSHID